MVFRITNTLDDDDYETIDETLSDKKLLEEGIMHMHADRGTVINIFRESDLEIPLARIGEKYYYGEISTSDAVTYDISIPIEYDSRENNFAGVVDLLKSRVPEGYSINTSKKTIEFFKGDLGYRASCVGKDMSIKTLRDRRIGAQSLKIDLNNLFFLTELVINTVYEIDNGEIELDLTAGIKGSRAILGRRKHSRLDRAIVMEKPTMTFQDIGGCWDAKAELMLLGHGLQKPESFRRWGIDYPRGILLYGLPGTGKTLLAKAMANLAKASLFCVSVTDVLSCYYGQSPKLIGKVFDAAQRNAPSIILFDEIDSLAQERSESDEETVKVVSVFLQKMDGIKGMENVTVIGTTNSMERIDRALLRPGRFDKIIEVTPPDKTARSDIFKLHCAGKRIDSAADFSAMANKSDGFTGADIREAVQMALGKKLREELATGNENISPVNTDDLLSSIEEYRKRRIARARMTSENSMMYA